MLLTWTFVWPATCVYDVGPPHVVPEEVEVHAWRSGLVTGTARSPGPTSELVVVALLPRIADETALAERAADLGVAFAVDTARDHARYTLRASWEGAGQLVRAVAELIEQPRAASLPPGTPSLPIEDLASAVADPPSTGSPGAERVVLTTAGLPSRWQEALPVHWTADPLPSVPRPPVDAAVPPLIAPEPALADRPVVLVVRWALPGPPPDPWVLRTHAELPRSPRGTVWHIESADLAGLGVVTVAAIGNRRVAPKHRILGRLARTAPRMFEGADDWPPTALPDPSERGVLVEIAEDLWAYGGLPPARTDAERWLTAERAVTTILLPNDGPAGRAVRQRSGEGG